MANIQVKFSASIKDLIDATNQVKGAIDSVAERAAAATDTLKKFGEIAGIGLSVEGIKAFVESMAELGEHTEKMSAMLGVSTSGVQELGYVAKMTGTDADSMANAMARFQLAIAKAQNPTSQQAAALRAFGLSARDLIGLPLDTQMAKFADAVSKFADGTNKTAAIGALNRALVGMIPLLDQGGAGFAKLTQHAVDTGAVISGQTVESLANLNRSSIGLKASLQAAGAELVALASKTLIDFANELASSAGNMTKLVESGNLTKYVLADLRGQIEELIAGLGKMAVAIGDAFSGHWGAQFTADMAQANAIITATAQHHAAELAKILTDSDAAYKQLIAHQEGSAKPQVKPIDVNRGGENSAALSAVNAEIALKDKAYQADVAHLNAMQKLGAITEQQKTSALVAAVNAREDAELKAISDVEAKGGLSVQQYQELENKKTAVIQKAVADRQKLVDQQYEAEVKTAVSAADQVAGAFNSQLRSMLSGHETFAQGARAIFGDMVIKMIEDIDKLALEWIAKQAMMAAAKMGFNLATGGVGALIPGFATGTYEVPSTGPALIHKGEMIIPAGPAENLRSGITGSGARFPEGATSNSSSSASSFADNRAVHVHYSGSNVNFRDHARDIAKAVVDHWQSNPSTRPKGW